MSDAKHILIAGAGLGGLAAAGCLLKAGYDIDVFEQAPELSEVGAGIQLSANAMHVLNHLGVGETVSRQSVRPEAYVFRLYDTGEEIHRFALADEHLRLHKAPYHQVHRADLHDALAVCVLDLESDAIHLNKKVTGFEEHADGIALRFDDGSSARRSRGWRRWGKIGCPGPDLRGGAGDLYRGRGLAHNHSRRKTASEFHGSGHGGMARTGTTRCVLLH